MQKLDLLVEEDFQRMRKKYSFMLKMRERSLPVLVISFFVFLYFGSVFVVGVFDESLGEVFMWTLGVFCVFSIMLFLISCVMFTVSERILKRLRLSRSFDFSVMITAESYDVYEWAYAQLVKQLNPRRGS